MHRDANVHRRKWEYKKKKKLFVPACVKKHRRVEQTQGKMSWIQKDIHHVYSGSENVCLGTRLLGRINKPTCLSAYEGALLIYEVRLQSATLQL